MNNLSKHQRWLEPGDGLPNLLAVLLLVAGVAAWSEDRPTPPPPVKAAVTMNPTAWMFQHSPGMPKNPSMDANGGWYFDFPSSDGVHYVVHGVRGWIGSRLRATIEITTLGDAYFDHRTKPDNTCGGDSYARFYFQRRGDDLTASKQFYRWWAQTGIKLQAGAHVVEVPLDPAQWSSVFSIKGDAAPSEFMAAYTDVQAVGFTFGGGCFYGHGVFVANGTARFVVREFVIE
jgi:hypothetical protein